MVSKRKVRKVAKVSSATPARPKSPQVDKPSTAEALIRFNGELIEELFSSQAWTEIAFPLLQESIAGVSGRLTNGRYHHGSLTRDWSGSNSIFIAGYQKGLMDFNNGLLDFVLAKDKLVTDKKEAVAESKAPIYNPFLEESDDN